MKKCKFNAKCVFRRNQRGVCQCSNKCNKYDLGESCAEIVEEDSYLMSFCELDNYQCLRQTALPFRIISCDRDVKSKFSGTEPKLASVFSPSTESSFYRIVDNAECENQGISVISVSDEKYLKILKSESVMFGNFSRKQNSLIKQYCHCEIGWEGEFCQWKNSLVGSIYVILGLTSVTIFLCGIRKLQKKKKQKKKMNQMNSESEELGQHIM